MQMMHEIEWDEPILPPVPDPPWEAEVKRQSGAVPDVQRRISPSQWIRSATLLWDITPPTHVPMRLVDMGSLATAQENACRYCYGAVRAQLKMLGYPEDLIGRIERDTQMAELDEKERVFLQFCRHLARSNPRPSREEREALARVGFSREAINEIIFLIARACFVNRVATFIAVPPEHRFEAFAGGPLGRMIGLFGPLMKLMRDRKARKGGANSGNHERLVSPAFQGLVDALGDLSAARLLQEALVGAFESPVLSHRIKVLIFGVVARSLGCTICPTEINRLLAEDGFSPRDVEDCLANLDSPKLATGEADILAWARDTVHYRPATIQKRSRALAQVIGEEALLEAVGVASLANAVVRAALIVE